MEINSKQFYEIVGVQPYDFIKYKLIDYKTKLYHNRVVFVFDDENAKLINVLDLLIKLNDIEYNTRGKINRGLSVRLRDFFNTDTIFPKINVTKDGRVGRKPGKSKKIKYSSESLLYAYKNSLPLNEKLTFLNLNGVGERVKNPKLSLDETKLLFRARGLGPKSYKRVIYFNYLDIYYPFLLDLTHEEIKSFSIDFRCEICSSTKITSETRITSKVNICSDKCNEAKLELSYINAAKRQYDNPSNYMINPKFSEEDRLRISMKKSVTMKKLIKDGLFTPNISNSWCNSKCYIREKPYRSSWEVMFHLLNPNLEYETLRVQYIGVDLLNHNYVVDFIDRERKIAYEVKPTSQLEDETIKLKTEAAEKWCKENGYKFKFITEEWIKNNKEEINDNLHKIDYPDTVRKIKMYLK